MGMWALGIAGLRSGLEESRHLARSVPPAAPARTAGARQETRTLLSAQTFISVGTGKSSPRVAQWQRAKWSAGLLPAAAMDTM